LVGCAVLGPRHEIIVCCGAGPGVSQEAVPVGGSVDKAGAAVVGLAEGLAVSRREDSLLHQDVVAKPIEVIVEAVKFYTWDGKQFYVYIQYELIWKNNLNSPTEAVLESITKSASPPWRRE
jgi:hypothetical protein